MADPQSKPEDSMSAKDSFDEELLTFLARQSKVTPVPIIVAMAAVAACAYGKVADEFVIGWMAIIIVVQLLRWVVMPKLAVMTDVPGHLRLRVAIGMSALNGIAQISSLCFFPYMSLYERSIQTMIFIGTSAISVVTTAGYKPISLAYVLPTMVPLFIFWAWSPGIDDAGWSPLFISFIGFSYISILLKLAGDTFTMFRQSYEARLQQLALNEQLTVALDEAEAANRAKTRFLASASHDLRQPIHTLSLYGATLGMQNLDAQTRTIVKHMDTALQALASQLDALLDVSKLDAGIVEVNKAPSCVNNLAARLYEEYCAEAANKKLDFTVEHEQTVYVDTDELLLERIIRNLVSNAIKYTDKGSVQLKISEQDGQCVIALTDTGKGIPEAEFTHIFEEFYQLDNPERDREKGLGLGLAIVKRLVSLLGIEISLKSSPDVGTQFTVRLPVVSKDEEYPTEIVSTDIQWGKLRILVIDDEEQVRHSMKMLLEVVGCTVHLSESTDTAVTQAKQNKPDIVLADFRLRGMDSGLTAIAKLRGLYAELPAILISGDTAPNRLREAEEAGISLLHKPVSADELKQAIAITCRHI